MTDTTEDIEERMVSPQTVAEVPTEEAKVGTNLVRRFLKGCLTKVIENYDVLEAVETS